MKHVVKPQPDGTTRDVRNVPDDYRPVRGEEVRDGPKPLDKADTFTAEARARELKRREMATPEGRIAALEAENTKLRDRLDKLERR